MGEAPGVRAREHLSYGFYFLMRTFVNVFYISAYVNTTKMRTSASNVVLETKVLISRRLEDIK